MMTDEISQALQSSDEDVRLQTVLNMQRPSEPDDIVRLSEMLSDKSWRVRKAVIQVVAQTDVKIVVPLLIRALSAGNSGIQNVRFHNSAIECLTIIGPPAIPALTAALQDEEKDVRIAAANVLGTIHHSDACDPLIQALHDPNINVRYAVVEALSKIPNQQSVIPLTKILEEDEEWLKLPAISALGHIGDFRATPYLIKMAEQDLYRQTVVEALGNIGDEKGIPCIIRSLSSKDKENRKSAVMAMDNISQKLDKFHDIIQRPSTYRALFRSACTESIMHHLILVTQEKDFNLALAAIKLLGWSDSQEAAYALLEQLGQEQFIEAVISALIQIGEKAIAPLAHAYETSRSLEKKLLIIDCFRELGGAHALQLLLKYLRESQEGLLTYAFLKAFTQQSFTSLIMQDRDHSPTRYYDVILKYTKEHLNSNHPLVRAEAVYLWGQLLGTKVLDDVLNATKDVDPTIQVNAIKHVGRFAKENPELIEHLVILLSDDHPNIRKQAAHALGKTENSEAFPALLLVLDDPDPMVRRAAVSGIGILLCRHPQEQYRQQVLEKLTDVLENRCRRYEDGFLKIEIAGTLRHIDADQSRHLLLQLAHDVDFDVRKAAILAIGCFKSAVQSLTPTLLTFLQDAHWSVREASVTALGLLENQNVEKELLNMLDDPDLTVRKALLTTLGRIGSRQAIPLLVEYLAHDDLDYAAYQGLTQLVEQDKERIAAYLSDENPKIHVFIKHILEQEEDIT